MNVRQNVPARLMTMILTLTALAAACGAAWAQTSPPSTEPQQVENRLNVLRAERDWTQADLAQALEVSRYTVNAIEVGKFDPSLPLAFKAARLFGMTIEEIFEDDAAR